MSKIAMIMAAALWPCAASAQKIVGDTAYGIKPMPYTETSVTEGLLEQEQLLCTIYLCVALTAIAAALAIYWIMRKRISKYSEAFNMQNQALQQQMRNAESFGLMLNLAQFPCCLISPGGNIVWCNDAFADFYGKDRKELKITEGATQDADIESIKDRHLGTSIMVKTKNASGKTIEFKRTIIPIKGGNSGFAVIENFTE